MSRCNTCGNDYDASIEIKVGDRSYTFDCFECAIHRLAPVCEGCGCRVLGHGVQSDNRMFCSSHCARARGVTGLQTHVWQIAAGESKTEGRSRPIER
jgi:hypothetical protein